MALLDGVLRRPAKRDLRVAPKRTLVTVAELRTREKAATLFCGGGLVWLLWLLGGVVGHPFRSANDGDEAGGQGADGIVHRRIITN